VPVLGGPKTSRGGLAGPERGPVGLRLPTIWRSKSFSRQPASAGGRGNLPTTSNPVGKVNRSEFRMEVDTSGQSYGLVTWLNLPEEQA
jgi:hypothetical protein